MPFSYSDPRTNVADAVRFAIGDTDARRPQLQDAEIAFCLDQASGNPAKAAVIACTAIIAKLGRMCDQTVGSVSKSFSQLQNQYKETLVNLRRAASSSGGIPIVGGTSRIANAAPYGNPDYVRPQYTARMMQRRGYGLPGTGGLTAGAGYREPGEEG